MDLFLLFYNFIFASILAVSSLVIARTPQEYLSVLLFVPLVLYFGNRLLKYVLRSAALKRLTRTTDTLIHRSTDPLTRRHADNAEPALVGEVLNTPPIRDLDRRLFLKLIASSGFSLFLLSLFTKRTHAAFFGSVPGPGTISVKDSSGDIIDPAEKQPTDGYEISQIDDTSSSDYDYYGFIDKNSNWYIMQETLTGANTGSYLYSAGTTGFSSNWTNRAALSYTTFDSAF